MHCLSVSWSVDTRLRFTPIATLDGINVNFLKGNQVETGLVLAISKSAWPRVNISIKSARKTSYTLFTPCVTYTYAAHYTTGLWPYQKSAEGLTRWRSLSGALFFNVWYAIRATLLFTCMMISTTLAFNHFSVFGVMLYQVHGHESYCNYVWTITTTVIR